MQIKIDHESRLSYNMSEKINGKTEQSVSPCTLCNTLVDEDANMLNTCNLCTIDMCVSCTKDCAACSNTTICSNCSKLCRNCGGITCVECFVICKLCLEIKNCAFCMINCDACGDLVCKNCSRDCINCGIVELCDVCDLCIGCQANEGNSD